MKFLHIYADEQGETPAIPIMAIGGEDTAKLDCCVRIIQPSNAS
jgi:hypothetical protein